MPAAVKMQDELEGDFHTVFVESQGHEMGDVHTLALKKQWYGTEAMWTTEAPMVTGARGIPNFVLLSSDGEVVMMGNPLKKHGQIEEYIAKDKKRRSKLPEGMPKSLAAAWKALVGGDYATATAAAEKLVAKGGAEGEAATKLLAMVAERATAQVDFAEQMLAGGFYGRAADQLDDLSGKLAQELDERARELREQLGSTDLAAEKKAEKALAKLQRKLFKKGVAKNSGRKFEKFVAAHDGTKAASRARELLESLD